jgi:hypothetical protein
MVRGWESDSSLSECMHELDRSSGGTAPLQEFGQRARLCHLSWGICKLQEPRLHPPPGAPA